VVDFDAGAALSVHGFAAKQRDTIVT